MQSATLTLVVFLTIPIQYPSEWRCLFNLRQVEQPALLAAGIDGKPLISWRYFRHFTRFET